MSELNNIPKHWQVKKLGEILKVSSGKGLKVNLLQGGNFPVYGGNGINGYHSEYLIEEPRLIIGRVGAKCGVTCITKPKSWVTDNALIVEPKISDFNIKFFQLKLEYENLNKLSVSTAQPVISGSKIYDYEILLPPLPEQLAIVSKIEELLSDLENGKQQLLTALQQLKVYRQSLLRAAFEGRLTNKEVKDGELPKGWKWLTIGNVSDKITDGEHFRPKTQEDGIPFLSAKDVRDNGVSFDDPLFISKDTATKALQRCNPEKGDILIVSRGATVGRMCIVNTNKVFCLLGSVILIKVSQKVENRFMNYVLKSPIANQKMITISGATAQQAIYLRDIKNIEIPLPSLSVQHQIVEILESKLTVCDKIEETISQSLLEAESLRQSILKKAFEGRLV